MTTRRMRAAAATARCCCARCSTRWRRAPAASMSTAPSAPAAIAARMLDAADCTRLGHRPRSRGASPAAPALAQQLCRPAAPGRRAASATWRELLAARRRRRASTASRSISASPRCSSTRPSAASPSASTARSTCAWSSDGPSAADLVNEPARRELADIIFRYGEERRAARDRPRHRRRARSQAPITRTLRAGRDRAPRRRPAAARDGIDPATRTFQALRIAVNDELGELDRGLAAAEALLQPGGRLAVVVLPFARGPRGQAIPARPRAAARRAARATCRRPATRRAPTSFRAAAATRPCARRRPRSRAIRAPARRGCAPPNAPTAPAWGGQPRRPRHDRAAAPCSGLAAGGRRRLRPVPGEVSRAGARGRARRGSTAQIVERRRRRSMSCRRSGAISTSPTRLADLDAPPSRRCAAGVAEPDRSRIDDLPLRAAAGGRRRPTASPKAAGDGVAGRRDHAPLQPRWPRRRGADARRRASPILDRAAEP